MKASLSTSVMIVQSAHDVMSSDTKLDEVKVAK